MISWKIAEYVALIAILWVGIGGPDCVNADEPQPDEAAFFRKKIEPVFQRHCYKCHSAKADELKAGLRLDSANGIQDGGDSGPAVVAGDLDRSLLYEALLYTDDFFQMPPTGKLPDKNIDDVRRWIKAGAIDPRQ